MSPLFPSFFFHLSIVELNEVGFKFVQKCINCIETKGKSADQEFIPSVWACVSWPEGGAIESLLPLHADGTPAGYSWEGGKSPCRMTTGPIRCKLSSLAHFVDLFVRLF